MAIWEITNEQLKDLTNGEEVIIGKLNQVEIILVRKPAFEDLTE